MFREPFKLRDAEGPELDHAWKTYCRARGPSFTEYWGNLCDSARREWLDEKADKLSEDIEKGKMIRAFLAKNPVPFKE